MMESALFSENDDPKPTISTNRNTLLSSLVESDHAEKLFEEDADLFGSLDDPPVLHGGASNGTSAGQDWNPLGAAVQNPPPPSEVSSKLAFSGLLGTESSGGLFDDIDEQHSAVERPATKQIPTEAVREAPVENVMHDLNLNDYNDGFGMGAGGAVPREEVLPPQPPQQQQQQQQYQQQAYGNQPPTGVMNAMAGSYYYSTSGAGQMHMPHHPSHSRPQQQPSVPAGMHAGHNVNLGAPQPYQSPYRHVNSFPQAPKALTDYVPPPPFQSPYGKITVSDPMLIQGAGLFAGPPHWTYLVTLHSKEHPNQPVSAVRRRFRHFVALESRLRQSIPGAILPPRPDKHPARAIEEASARQSAEFAQLRGVELTTYMNALAIHPYAAGTPELKLFLTLQDHIGTAWPEVSGSALTRLSFVGSASVERLADTVDGMLSELGTAQQVAAGEDSAEILALAAYEGRRIGAVSGSVPKMEGTTGILKERGDRFAATGLEMSKLAKDVAWCDRELSGPMEVLSSALLRSGRRTKRLGLEVGAGIAPFVTQYKLCRYEQMAFVDRRTALKRRSEARSSADRRAAKVMMNQTSISSMGRLGTLEKMEMEAAMFDEMATEAAREADDVALRLQSEVGRIGSIRVREWDGGMKVVARAMKEACAENAAIWEATLECFKREFPEVQVPNGVNGVLTDGVGGKCMEHGSR